MEELRKWPKGQKLTINEAGNLVSLSGVQWSRMENGHRNVAALKVMDVEAVTGISRHVLRPDIFGTDAPGKEVNS